MLNSAHVCNPVLIGEELPDEESWTFLTETNGGHPTEPPFIAFRRRVYSNRLDHICQVKFVAPGEVVPPHFELLRSTASGKGSGYIKPHGYLAIKRAPVNEDYAISGKELLFDICIVRASLKEQIPEHYFQIEKDSVGAIAAFSSHDTIVAIRKLPAMGICDLGYAASPLDRYPLKVSRALLTLPDDAHHLFSGSGWSAAAFGGSTCLCVPSLSADAAR